MPTQAEYNALVDRVAKLELLVGLKFADKPPTPADLIPANEIPGSGRYPSILADYQIRLTGLPPIESDVEELAQRVTALELKPPGSIEVPPATGVLPLVPANGRKVGTVDMRPTNSIVYNDGDLPLGGVEIHDKPQAFLAPVAIGGMPIDSDQQLQIRKGGEILFLTKVLSANTQEKNGDKLRSGVFSANPYDNGMGMIRGGFWRNGVLHRTENIIQMLKMDSAGWVSKSHEDYSKPEVERSQLWIIREDFARRVIQVVPCRAGWGVEMAASTDTTNMNNDESDGEPNFDRSATLIEPLVL